MPDPYPTALRAEAPAISEESFLLLNRDLGVVYPAGSPGNGLSDPVLSAVLPPGCGEDLEPALRRALDGSERVRLDCGSFALEAWPALGGLAVRVRPHGVRGGRVGALEAALRDLPVATALLRGPDFRCELHNPALAAIFPGRPVENRPAAQLFSEWSATLLPALEAAAAGSGPQRPGPVESGGRWFEPCCTPVEDAGEPAVLLTAVETAPRALARYEQERLDTERWRLAVEGAGMGAWSWDILAGELTWCQRCKELFGLPPGAEIGVATFDAALHPEDRERVRAAVDRCLAELAGFELEYRIVRPDGSVHWMLDKGRVWRDAAGRPVRMHGLVSDICARRQAERRLRDSEARLRMALEVGALSLWELDVDQDVLTADGSARELYGFDAQVSSRQAWMERVHPEDRPRLEEAYRTALAGCGSFTSDYRVLHPAGLRWAQSTGTVVRDAAGRARVLGLTQEITARKQAEEDLRRSEERYRQIVENTHEGVWLVDAAGATLYANGRMAAMLACEPEELRSLGAFDFVFEEDRDSGERELELSKSLATGRRLTFRYRRADNTELWAEVASSPIRDGEGRFTALLGLFTDVTARRQAEAERDRFLLEQRRQREFLEKLVANAPASIAVVSAAGHRVRMANAAFEAMAGRPAAGLPVEEVLPGETGVRLGAHVAEVCRTGNPFRVREQALALPGPEITCWNADFVPLYGPDGKPESVLLIAQEVTDTVSARRRAEELAAVAERRAREAETATLRFRRLIEGGIIGIAVADPARISYCNDALMQILGYSREELASLDWQAITTPDTIHLDRRAVRELYETGCCEPYEKAFFRKDGSRVPILLGATLLSPPPDPQWIAFVIDLTERKRLEEQLLQAQKMESIGVLAGGIAHDFNNLLTGILGNASLVLEDMHPLDRSRPFLANVIAGAERAADLTRQMLAYAGKGRFIVGPVDLSAEVAAVVDLLRASIPANVRVETDLADRLPVVEADSGQIQQVIMNLVLNAAEAIGNEPGRVLVRTRAGQPGPDLRVSLEVEDTGCGMDDATLARAFEPFYTTKFTGRGLGLSAVEGIVKAQRGSIRVSSEPGKGTRFALLFPAAEPPPAPIPAPDPAGTALHGTGVILVVDDEEPVRRVARTALERYGYTVLLACDGREAVDLFHALHGTIRAVVLDATMPVMSGEEALREFRRIRPDIPVLLSSGYSQSEAARRFGDRIAGFIGKPYTAAALARSVKAACEPPGQLPPRPAF